MSMITRLFSILFVIVALTATVQAQPKESLTFGRIFMGDLGNGTQSSTELLLTNRDPAQGTCKTLVFFFVNGTAAEPQVRFNGEAIPGNAFEVDIPQGGNRKVLLSVDGGLVAGAVVIAPFAPCDENSISGSGRFLIESSAGALNEIYTISPNGDDKWLRNNRCVAISSCFRRTAGSDGFGNNLGIATTSVLPGVKPPPGTTLQASVFDTDGSEMGDRQVFNVDGSHQAFFPLNSFSGLTDGPLVLVLCLFSPDTAYRADLTTIQTGTDNNGNVQFDAPSFADGFESGDLSAWKD